MAVANITAPCPSNRGPSPTASTAAGTFGRTTPTPRVSPSGAIAASATADRPVTPAGMPRPGTPPAAPAAAARPPGGDGAARGGASGPAGSAASCSALGAVVLLLVCSGCTSATARSPTRSRKANKRLDKRTEAALAPAGNILRSPQVTLVLGSDSRGAGTTARADSILLMRTDPGKHLISMLSIPRDLLRADPRPRRAPRSTPPSPTAGRRS